MAEEKRRRGDRWDGKLMRNVDGMHFVMPIVWPNRTDNEAYISEQVDLAPIRAWIAEKNALPENQEFPFTFFHLVVVALLKTITLRPHLNRFIADYKLYQRNFVSASFVVKKRFADDSEEGLARVEAGADDNIFTLHQQLFSQISFARREDVKDSTSDAMDMFARLPRFLSQNALKFVCYLERKGKCPRSFPAADPYYNSVLLSNLGSIQLQSGYHHLTNWGTCSLFCVIGKIRNVSTLQPDGSILTRELMDLGLTVDERLSDGYYFAKSLRLLRKLLAEPALLELPMVAEIEY